MMHLISILTTSVVLLSPDAVRCANPDRFNYRRTVGNDYGPKDWGKVGCTNHRNCPGWPDDWETYNSNIPYAETENSCKDCSSKTSGECKNHKQSPINLTRNITRSRICEDRHWMAYKRGTCGYGRMRFRIEPHTLRAYQPMDKNAQSTCEEPSSIDFSWGFPDDWHLVHTDIKVPSEHMQDGKRYDAEVVLAHIYSKNKPDKHIGKVAIFLERGEESDRYEFLDLYLKRWRKVARKVREHCESQRNLERLHNVTGEEMGTPESARSLRGSLEYEKEEEFAVDRERELFRVGGRKFSPYDWLKQVQTEYYFRYEGSQGVPPCLEAVHWRVMRESIKVAPSQIDELERLMRSRIDRKTCVRENAGVYGNGIKNFNRPIQTTTQAHKVVFCECIDWPSKQAVDQQWCAKPDAERGVHPFVHW